MQLLLKLEKMRCVSMTTEPHCDDEVKGHGDIAVDNGTSLFTELEMLSHSLSVDSFTSQPSRPILIGTQVDDANFEQYLS